MVTNKYIWINRSLLDLNLQDRRLGLICRLSELMVEDGTLMMPDESKPATSRYIVKFAKINRCKLPTILKELIDCDILSYDDSTSKYRFNEKYVVLPKTKNKKLTNYVRVSCFNYDKLFSDEFDSRCYQKLGHLVRLALHIGVLDNSVRDNIYCTDADKFIYLGIDEVFYDYSKGQVDNIQKELDKLNFKEKECVTFYKNKIVVNPLLFNTSKIILRKRTENKPFVSLGEEMVKLFLDKYEIDYETQKRYSGLVGVNGGELSYDFYLPSYNMLIECQGSQHYQISTYNDEKDFVKQREHDHRKWEYAKNNGIALVEVPYWHYNDVEQYLLKLELFNVL